MRSKRSGLEGGWKGVGRGLGVSLFSLFHERRDISVLLDCFPDRDINIPAEFPNPGTQHKQTRAIYIDIKFQGNDGNADRVLRRNQRIGSTFNPNNNNNNKNPPEK